jgi:CRISPR/Cas system-associated protein Cas5 (RAMP superfamily)
MYRTSPPTFQVRPPYPFTSTVTGAVSRTVSDVPLAM